MNQSAFLICGEALFDIFEQGTYSDPKQADYQARIGGSPYNVAMGLARMGQHVAFFSGISSDFFGLRLRQAIAQENIADWALVTKDNPTTLSFVALDEAGSPEYAFFNRQAADISLIQTDIPPLQDANKIIHAGSYSLVVPPTSATILALMEQNRGKFISIDPNIRPTVEPDMGVWRNHLYKLLPYANLIKVSAEDLTFLDPSTSILDTAHHWLQQGPELIIITDGGDRVTALNAQTRVTFKPEPVKIVDSVGAGDTFMAATLYHLYNHGFVDKSLKALSEQDLIALMAFASKAAGVTCSRRGADLPTLTEINA